MDVALGRYSRFEMVKIRADDYFIGISMPKLQLDSGEPLLHPHRSRGFTLENLLMNGYSTEIHEKTPRLAGQDFLAGVETL